MTFDSVITLLSSKNLPQKAVGNTSMDFHVRMFITALFTLGIKQNSAQRPNVGN